MYWLCDWEIKIWVGPNIQGYLQWFMSVILATQEAENRRIGVQGQPRQIVQETLSQKYPTHKRTSGVTQAVEQLPSKHEALSSNSSTTKKKESLQESQPYFPLGLLHHQAAFSYIVAQWPLASLISYKPSNPSKFFKNTTAARGSSASSRIDCFSLYPLLQLVTLEDGGIQLSTRVNLHGPRRGEVILQWRVNEYMKEKIR
jgi:hypothetical protein